METRLIEGNVMSGKKLKKKTDDPAPEEESEDLESVEDMPKDASEDLPLEEDTEELAEDDELEEEDDLEDEVPADEETPEDLPEDIESEIEDEEEDEEEEEEDEEDEDEEPEVGIFNGLYNKFFANSWEMWVGSIILAILSIGLFMIKSPWGSSGGLLNLGQNLFHLIGMPFDESAPSGVTDFWDSRYGMLSIMMLIGAFASALLGKEFAVRISPIGELVKGLIGGLLMGVGCVLAMGCTVGGFFTGWAAMSGGALIFVVGLVIGVFIAVRYLIWEMMKFPNISSGKSWTFLQPKSEGPSLHPFVGAIVLVVGAAIALIYDVGVENVLIGFVLIGLLIGVVLQRSRWCIVRAVREPFMTGDADPAVAIIAGILVGLFGFTIIKIMGIAPELTMVGANFFVPALVGGLIFGFGMTVAGGCTVGSTWRAGEGHVKLWFALLGIVIAAPLTAEFIKPAFLDVLPATVQKQVFLPEYFGYPGSVFIMVLILLLWYLFVQWNERTGKLSAF